MIENKVLVIAYYFPPMGLSGVQRTLKFVKYLPNYSWQPIVLTSNPRSYYAFDQTLLEEIDGKDIEIFRTPSKKSKKDEDYKQVKFPSYLTQKMGRAFLQAFLQPDTKIRWKKAALRLGSEILKKHEVKAIFATAPPFTDFLIAKELANAFHLPFIVDYRDIWVGNPFHFNITPFHKVYATNLEKEILTCANTITVTTRHLKEHILKRYKFLTQEDVVVISHGYDPEDFAFEEKVMPDPKKFTITHSGVFQDDRTPEHFLKAFSNFLELKKGAKEHSFLKLIGVMRNEHIKLIKKLMLESNVNVTGYLSHKDAVKNLMDSDLLWLMLNDTARSPGKLYEYFGAKKTLLITAPDGLMKRQAMESKAAFCTAPNDIDAITKALLELYDLWKQGKLPVPSDNFIKQFNRIELTGYLAKELSSLIDINS